MDDKDLPTNIDNTNGSVQDCSNSSALAMELLQSYNKPSMADVDLGVAEARFQAVMTSQVDHQK